MIDVTTDAGYAQIKWVSAPPFDVENVQWTCYCILHGGDGPLGYRMFVHAPVGKRKIHPSEAAEMAAALVYDVDGGGLCAGGRETIQIAVQLQGLEFCAYGVVVRLEPQFDAREL